MAGFIKLSRNLQVNSLWLSEPFTRGQAWVDLLMLANFEDGFIFIRGNQVTVRRGQCGWSEVKLAERWSWSRGKVRRFLKTLILEQQIEQQKNAVTSLITIINYELYQGNGQQVEQQAVQQTDSRRTADGTLRKNDKKNNNDKKVTRTFTRPTIDQVTEYCNERQNKIDPQRFIDHYTSNGWKVGKNSMKDWKAAIRTWEKRDGKSKQPPKSEFDNKDYSAGANTELPACLR